MNHPPATRGSAAQPPAEPSSALDWLVVAIIAVCGMFAGLLEVLIVPLYVGTVIVPVAIVCALVSNIALPWLARSVVPRTAAALLPFIGWLIVVIVLGAIARPEGDVILPGSPTSVEIVGYGVMLGGALAGTITIVWLTPPPASRKVSR